MTWDKLLPMLWEGTVETLYMTLWSSAIAYLIGLPLGVLLVVTRRGGIMPSPTFNAILGVAINFLRSIPFIIMLAVLFPVTRVVVGTAIGTKSIIFPLVISAFPYIARMVESSLEEVDHGIIEAAQSMGSTNLQLIFKVLLPEAVPSLVNGAAISITTILGYTAMASAAGGGGLARWPSSRVSTCASSTSCIPPACCWLRWCRSSPSSARALRAAWTINDADFGKENQP